MTVAVDECLVESASIDKTKAALSPLSVRPGKRITVAMWFYTAQIIKWRALKRLERDLERIDDRMLKDIGLDRSEIRRVVRFGREF